MALSEQLGPILAVILLGSAGWRLATRLRFPAPAMIGPMLVIAASGLLGLPAITIPAWFRITIQAVIGGFIGRRIDRSTVDSIKHLLPVVIVTTTWFMAGTVLLGLLVARWASIDLGTAILATVPGGVAEMTALAISSRVDVAFVATMQTLRVLAANTLVPIIARRKLATPGDIPPRDSLSPQRHRDFQEVSEGSPGNPNQKNRTLHWGVGLSAALLGGGLLTFLKLPAGAIMGAMLAVALLQFSGFEVQAVPKSLLIVAYIGLGISVGSTFNVETFLRLRSSAGILIVTTTATLASSFLLSFIIRKKLHLDQYTALLACSPGGLSLMAVVAEEIGAQAVIVSFLHLSRIIWIIIAMPILLRLLS